jgi:hypothetical protein
MGRYVSGDFEYKFSFAEQESNFGEILDQIVTSKSDTDNWLERYIGRSGEIVRLGIYDIKGLRKAVKKYVGKFKLTEDELEKMEGDKQELWDKFMMIEFLKELENKENDTRLEFFVEY